MNPTSYIMQDLYRVLDIFKNNVESFLADDGKFTLNTPNLHGIKKELEERYPDGPTIDDVFFYVDDGILAQFMEVAITNNHMFDWITGIYNRELQKYKNYTTAWSCYLSQYEAIHSLKIKNYDGSFGWISTFLNTDDDGRKAMFEFAINASSTTRHQ